jgi:hypothetical protein
MTITAEFTAADHDALERALRLMLANKTKRDHFEHLLERHGRHEAATRASYIAQIHALKLKAWQAPPCEDFGDEVGPGYGRSKGEVELRLRMRALNISLYEPDPRAAIAAAEAKLLDVV